MSSATSTDIASNPPKGGSPGLNPPADGSVAGLQPWQFFVLAALACATAVTYMVRGEGLVPVVLLSVLMGAAALVGLAALRTVRPLVTSHEDRTAMVGERTRVALEREKMLALRTLKELEFDRAMKKISEDDFREMSTRLRARAGRIMRQLDAGSGYRARIEADLAKRLGEKEARKDNTCTACVMVNDPDARFCKGCGQKL
jgi:hypothetical protein